jgi:hypothetical protein
LRGEDGSINQNIRLDAFNSKKVIDLAKGYLGTHVE